MTRKNILITGANSGLGLDSARQFALSGRWDAVLISARSQAKAEDAITHLMAATGKERHAFGYAIFDNNKPETIEQAVDGLAADGVTLGAVVLNAGGVPRLQADGGPPRTADGTAELYAMNVGGHVRLIDELLRHSILTQGATIMFAGSEASRGVPAMGMKASTLPVGHGDLESTVRAVARAEHVKPGYDIMADYGLIKLIGTLWMRQLSGDHGLRAFTVSPGFTGGTEVMNKLPAIQRFMFRYVMLPLLKTFGNAHKLEYGAARYVEAVHDERFEAGQFYASPGKKISGPLTKQESALQPLLADERFEAAVGAVVRELAVASAS